MRYSIKADDVKELSTLLGHLSKLYIQETDTETLVQLSKHCASLEFLMISNYNIDSKSIFPYFPKLTHICDMWSADKFHYEFDSRYNDQLQSLWIPNVCDIDIACFTKLRALKDLSFRLYEKSKLNILPRMQLERLWLWSSEYLNQLDVLKLVKECPSLKYLSCDCGHLDEDFFPSLLDILEAKNFQADRPFDLNIKSIENKVKVMTLIAGLLRVSVSRWLSELEPRE